jgi:hypothetical protein
MVKVLDVFFDEKPRNEQSKRKIKKTAFWGGGGIPCSFRDLLCVQIF